MKTTERNPGIAIVSVVLVLAATMLLGIASLFLTQVNLGISKNVRSSTLASNAATAGLNAAFVTLQDYFGLNGDLPSTLTLPTIAGHDYQPSYSLADYRVSGDTAYVSIIGRGGTDAEYVSEALIQFSGGSGLANYFAYGLATESTFTKSGTGAYINAGIHANKGFKLSGVQEFYVCTARDAQGVCTSTQAIGADAIPISASPGATTCSVSGGLKDSGLCVSGTPANLTDPVTITPDFASHFQNALDTVSKGSLYSNTLGIYCDYIFASVPAKAAFFNAVAGLPSASTVCVEGNGTLSFSGSGYSFDNMNLVVRNDVSFSGTYSTSNFVLISVTGSLKGSGSSTFDTMQAYAKKDLDFSGTHTIVGRSTFAAGGNLTISGSAAAVTTATGDPAIGVALIAEGNIKISGSSKLYVAAVAGGTFTKSGVAEFVGRAASKGAMDISGSFRIDAGLPIDNDSLVQAEPAVLKVVSIR